jgi:nitrogen fixation-related uncharacterized protein
MARVGCRSWIIAGCLALGGFAVTVASAAGDDDKHAAEAALRDVEASPKKAVAAEPVARARAAIERSTRMRAAGDESHARLADSLARAWAEVARDVARAAEVEARGAAMHEGAADAGTVAERERALLEEAVAQSGRLRAQLEASEHGTKESPTRTSAAAREPVGPRDKTDGGAPRTPKPAPAKADGGAR